MLDSQTVKAPAAPGGGGYNAAKGVKGRKRHEPADIPSRRPYRRKGWFSDGELPRRILDALRTSPKPLSASAVTASVMSAKGLDTGDAATLLVTRKGVQSYLRRQSGALVEPTGRKGRDGLWRVSETDQIDTADRACT